MSSGVPVIAGTRQQLRSEIACIDHDERFPGCEYPEPWLCAVTIKRAPMEILKSALSRLMRPAIYRSGWAIVPSTRHYTWPQHVFMCRLFEFLKTDCIFDVGANVGQYGKDLRMIGYRGLILSFEPDPASFEKLKARSERDGNWHSYNMALGPNQGTMTLNVMKDPVFNSFLKPKHTEMFPDNEIERSISVKVESLDRIFKEMEAKHHFRYPFLKMDTQGFDLDVIRGANEVCQSFCGLQSELSFQPIYESMPTWHDSISCYQSLGFQLAAMYPVHPNLFDLVEMDCFMTRKP